MDNDNKILSQEEIDAILSGADPNEVVPPPEGPSIAANLPIHPSPNVKLVPASGLAEPVPLESGLDSAPTQPPKPEPEPMEFSMSDLASADKIRQLERALAETNASLHQMRQEYQSMMEQMQLISSRMEGVLLNLKATIGYRAQKTFTCNSCESNGNVAAKVKCTQCGEENWWGWWPQNK